MGTEPETLDKAPSCKTMRSGSSDRLDCNLGALAQLSHRAKGCKSMVLNVALAYGLVLETNSLWCSAAFQHVTKHLARATDVRVRLHQRAF